ncbi:MAG: haloacid dehalogenase [Thermoprotei archaeon]|nr:MAG: haloacid dehalogenase [Thermoprotei archaeon]
MASLAVEVDRVLERDVLEVDDILSVKDSVREEAIRLSREIIRTSAEAVRMIHLGRISEARSNIFNAIDKVKLLTSKLKEHPDLFYSGLVYNCLSEYVEAYVFYNLVVESKMPSLNELDVPYIPYLQGLGDVIGELRRYIIDLLKKREYSEASLYLDVMETIYQWLKKLNYPDALMPGVRHKVDIARRLIEDTKVLYLNTINSYELRKRIEEISKKLS